MAFQPFKDSVTDSLLALPRHWSRTTKYPGPNSSMDSEKPLPQSTARQVTAMAVTLSVWAQMQPSAE